MKAQMYTQSSRQHANLTTHDSLSATRKPWHKRPTTSQVPVIFSPDCCKVKRTKLKNISRCRNDQPWFSRCYKDFSMQKCFIMISRCLPDAFPMSDRRGPSKSLCLRIRREPSRCLPDAFPMPSDAKFCSTQCNPMTPDDFRASLPMAGSKSRIHWFDMWLSLLMVKDCIFPHVAPCEQSVHHVNFHTGPHTRVSSTLQHVYICIYQQWHVRVHEGPLWIQISIDIRTMVSHSLKSHGNWIVMYSYGNTGAFGGWIPVYMDSFRLATRLLSMSRRYASTSSNLRAKERWKACKWREHWRV